jgi:hypothetical protein
MSVLSHLVRDICPILGRVALAAILLLPQSASAMTSAGPLGPPVPGERAFPRHVSAFHISGNRIVDRYGRPFVVRGADAVYGRFAGGNANGWGLINYQNARRDLDNMKDAGYNLVRISASYDLGNLSPTSPDYIPFTQYLNELDNVVKWVTQRGMVAELSNGQTARTDDVNAFAALLAVRYATNPLVWLKPDNEPNCEDGDRAVCLDWVTWQLEEARYVRTIRAAGFTGPIVVNCIAWSFDCSQALTYPLGDDQLIYGAHAYGAGATTWDPAQQADADAKWAYLSARVPVIVDEVGTTVPPTSPLTWSQGFLTYVVHWVRERSGSGCIAFVNSWSSDNAMIDATTGKWNAWGQTYIDSYLHAFSEHETEG